MNTYANRAANPRRMRTSKMIELKASYNEHLQKKGGGGPIIVNQTHPRRQILYPRQEKRTMRQSAVPIGNSCLMQSGQAWRTK
jgi:hypothetical protein